jgi:hypothetical protein
MRMKDFEFYTSAVVSCHWTSVQDLKKKKGNKIVLGLFFKIRGNYLWALVKLPGTYTSCPFKRGT